MPRQIPRQRHIRSSLAAGWTRRRAAERNGELDASTAESPGPPFQKLS